MKIGARLCLKQVLDTDRQIAQSTARCMVHSIGDRRRYTSHRLPGTPTPAEWTRAYGPDTNLIYMNGIDWCAQGIKGPTSVYKKGEEYLGWRTITVRAIPSRRHSAG